MSSSQGLVPADGHAYQSPVGRLQIHLGRKLVLRSILVIRLGFLSGLLRFFRVPTESRHLLFQQRQPLRLLQGRPVQMPAAGILF